MKEQKKYNPAAGLSQDTRRGDITGADEQSAWASIYISRQAGAASTASFWLEKLFGGAELERIAEDPTTDAVTLITLAFSPSSTVRKAVADNRNTPLAILLMLAHDENLDLRYQMAENHNLPRLVLQELIEDVNPYISCRAQRTLAVDAGIVCPLAFVAARRSGQIYTFPLCGGEFR